MCVDLRNRHRAKLSDFFVQTTNPIGQGGKLAFQSKGPCLRDQQIGFGVPDRLLRLTPCLDSSGALSPFFLQAPRKQIDAKSLSWSAAFNTVFCSSATLTPALRTGTAFSAVFKRFCLFWRWQKLCSFFSSAAHSRFSLRVTVSTCEGVAEREGVASSSPSIDVPTPTGCLALAQSFDCSVGSVVSKTGMCLLLPHRAVLPQRAV